MFTVDVKQQCNNNNSSIPWNCLFVQCSWLVGCFGFNGPLRQYFSLYRAVSQREGERGEKGQRRVKMSKQPPPAPTASAIGPCPTVVKIVGHPGTGSLPSTIAPPDHPIVQCRSNLVVSAKYQSVILLVSKQCLHCLLTRNFKQNTVTTPR